MNSSIFFCEVVTIKLPCRCSLLLGKFLRARPEFFVSGLLEEQLIAEEPEPMPAPAPEPASFADPTLSAHVRAEAMAVAAVPAAVTETLG